METQPLETVERPAEICDWYALAVLRRLRDRGWLQGALRRPDGVCLVGAAEEVAWEGAGRNAFCARSDEMVDFVERLATRILGSPPAIPGATANVVVVGSWNDKPGRTQAEVEELLERQAYGA